MRIIGVINSTVVDPHCSSSLVFRPLLLRVSDFSHKAPGSLVRVACSDATPAPVTTLCLPNPEFTVLPRWVRQAWTNSIYTSRGLVCGFCGSRLLAFNLAVCVSQSYQSKETRPIMCSRGRYWRSSECLTSRQSLSNEHWILAYPSVVTSLINVRSRR